MYCIFGHIVTVKYSWSLSNLYLREGIDEGFGLNSFDGGAPGGGPGGSIDARGRFFGAWLLGIARDTNFFSTVRAIWDLGLVWCASDLRLRSL